MKNRWRVLLLLVFFFQIFFIIDASFSLVYAYNSYNWKTTTGTVLVSQVVNGSSNDGNQLDFKYSYTVKGITYYAYNVDATGPYFLSRIVSNSVIDASYFANHYHVGSPVTVYYDQSNPHNSAIVRGFAPAHYADIIILILMIFSFSMAILFYNKDTFITNVSTTPEKIMLSELVQFMALLFTVMVTIAGFLVYYLFMIFTDAILLTLEIYILNGLVILFHILNASGELLSIVLYGLFILAAILLSLILAKGFYSLWI